MSTELKNNKFTFKLLVLINAVLVCAILLTSKAIKHAKNNGDDCQRNERHFSIDAINSVTVKLM